MRFDMGTRCGPQYVDIQVVPLPGARSAYADNFGAIASAVSRALGAAAGPRNTIIMAEASPAPRRSTGSARHHGPVGEQPGATNVHNRGGLTSILFSRDGVAAPGAARWGWWPEGFLHEITHNLGAVQWGAPHSTQPRGAEQPALRPLLAGRGRHVLRRGRRRRARDADRLRGPPRRDPAELRLRPRRLLQPGARRPAPTSRRTGTRTTRRSSRPAARSPRPAAAARAVGPRAPGRDRRPERRRHAAPRLDAAAARRRLEQRARRATPTSGSASPRRLEDIDGETGPLRRHAARTSAAACASR